MAFHHRLALWQKVLLGVFCFPLLPFYLCYLCCASDEEEDEEAKGRQDVGVTERGTTEQRNDTPREHAGRASEKKGRKGQKDSLELHRSKVTTKIHQENETVNETSRDTDGGRVTFEMQPKSLTPQFLKKLSFGKGKQNSSIRGQDNRGFQGEGNKNIQEQKAQKGCYVYPWDKTNLKSLKIDLKKFQKLDEYASKVDVKGSVENLVGVLLKDAHTELEKVRAIWMWVCHHIEYDTVGFHSKEARSSDSKDILQSRKGVCAGYSSLFLRMCSVAGVQCENISGCSKGYGYTIGQRFSGDSNHAWNAVYLEGRWHLLDSTWGAGNVSDGCSKFNFKYNELYFLTHPAIFIESHFPTDKDWQLLNPALSIKQFEDNLCHESIFYNLGLRTSSPDTPVIKTVNGKAVISMEGCAPTLFTFKLNGAEHWGMMILKEYGMELEIYPQATGSHKLHISATPATSSDNFYNRVLEYVVECNSVDKKRKFPKDLHNPVGPSWLTEKKGFLHPSQPDPIILTSDGRCSVSFSLKEEMDILATLHTDDMTVTEDVERRYILKWQQENQVVLKIQLPQAGTFVLKIFYKSKRDSSYNYALNYLLSCTNAAVKWPIFPLIYSTWLASYELVEPTAGVLPANRNVHFKLKVPGVSSVFVKDKKYGTLTLSADGYWEGFFNTTGSQDVNVHFKESPNQNSYSSLLNYQVETS